MEETMNWPSDGEPEMPEGLDSTGAESDPADIISEGETPATATGTEMERPAIAELQAVASTFNTAFNAALYELETSRKQNEVDAARIGELDEAILSLRGTLDDRISEAGRKEEEYSQAAEALRQQIDDLESVRAQLQEKVREQDGIVAAQAGEIGRLTSRVEEQDALLEQRAAEVQHALQAYEQDRECSNRSLEALQTRYDEAEHALTTLRSELEERNNEMVGLRGQLDERSLELESRAGELADLARQLTVLRDDYQAQSESLRSQEEQHAHVTEEMNVRIADVTGELDALRSTHTELAAHAEKVETLNRALHESSISENAVHRKQLDEKAGVIESLRAKLASAADALEHRADRAAEADRQAKTLHDLEVRLEAVESERQELAGRAAQVDELAAENEHLADALQAATASDSTREEAVQELAALQGRLAGLQSELENSRSEQKLLEERLQDFEQLRQEVAGLRESATQAGAGQMGAEGHDATLAALRAEVEQLREALAASGQKCTELEAALAGADADEAAAVAGDQAAGQPRHGTVSTAIDRARFVERLEKLLADRDAVDTGHSIMYILLDNFVLVRDEIGVMESEHVIDEISAVIASFCDEADMMARFGDCTFAVACSGKGLDETEAKAERIRLAIENSIYEYGGRSVVATASIGICSVRKSDAGAADVIARADLSCEAARSYGGNQVLVNSAVSDRTISTGINEHHHEMVRVTLDENRAKLYYQPISSLKKQLKDYYEVLIRVVDGSGNIILPGEFIAMADSTGQARDVDRYVIENVMQMLAENREQELRLFIKLTRQSVANHDFPVWIIGKIKEYRLRPEQFVFEVSENIVQSDIKNLSMLSRALDAIGCKIAIEHYRMACQLHHLKHIHAHYLKIDSGLVESLSRKGASFSKVAAIMEMAKQNGYITIAEGVESPAALAILWELGVDMAQGYFIQAPEEMRDYDFQSVVSDGEEATGNKATFMIG